MKRIVVEVISVLILSLFLYAAISKIMDYSVFKEQLADSPILGRISGFLAWMLPAFELALVVLLAVPRWRLKGLYTSLVLLLVFIVYIIVMMATVDHLPCSCGGLLEQLSWKGHIIFNGIFSLLAAIAIRLQKQLIRHNRSDIISGFA